jgi:predicted metal-dependent hydrolase
MKLFQEFIEGELRYYARSFGLPLKRIEWLGPRRKFFGDCKNGRIRIQLRRRRYRIYPYHLIDTMAHELAHLRYPNHKPRWFDLHLAILGEMHVRGLYHALRKLMS